MGFFQRLATLIKSNLNDLISRSEDPEKMLNQIVEDMTNQLGEAKKMVALSIADEKKLEKETQGELAKAAEWERRAMLAVKAGDDNLAKEALSRKKEHESLGEQFKDQWQKQKASVEQLKLALRALNAKIEEAKRKKNLLIARQRRAQAQQRIHETMSSMSEKSAFEAFARMEERIETNERQLKASVEIEEEFTGDRLQQDFKALEKGATGAQVDARLLELKQKMGVLPAGSGGTRGQLGAGKARDAETVDAEVEDGGTHNVGREEKKGR
jgi:phage shock protein A